MKDGRADLSVRLAGMQLRNPLLPGSGPPGDSLAKLQRLQAAGVGALVTKTISVAPARVPKPCMAFDGDLFFNIEKWSVRPYQEWLADVFPALQARSAPLIASVGYTPEDIATLIPALDPWVDAFEVSTHYLARGAADWLAFVRLAKSLTSRPVIMKLSVHAGDIVANARLCQEGGADAVTAINSVGPVMSIDIEKRASRLGEDNPYLWLSGPAIKPVALRAVYDIARAVSIPVIACGGVASATDVIEFVLAGATAVQCCTALARHGPDIVPRILTDLESWCDSHNVAALRDLTGTVTPHYVSSRGLP